MRVRFTARSSQLDYKRAVLLLVFYYVIFGCNFFHSKKIRLTKEQKDTRTTLFSRSKITSKAGGEFNIIIIIIIIIFSYPCGP